MSTIKTAYQLLAKMREAGFTVRANGDIVEVTQARWIDDELADLIRTFKSDLLEILEREGEVL